MSSHIPTGSQTVGPFFAIGLDHLFSAEVTQPVGTPEAPLLHISGRILDGQGVPVPDAFLEIWQADPTGRYSDETDLFDLPTHSEPGHAVFPGFARVVAGPEGTFAFTNRRPGPVPYDENTMQAPHLLVFLFMRGLLRHLVTRLYFPDSANATDPILLSIPEPRRATLIATAGPDNFFYWDLRLRGELETVFFQW